MAFQENHQLSRNAPLRSPEFSTEANHSNTPVSAALMKSHLAHFDIIYMEEKK